ncbi:MAG: nuclear transport factor 2 family protein [Terracidiphilus sp.]|jgi:ketosteroid isomerase-like protein
MHAATFNPAKPIRRRSLYVLVILLVLGAYAPMLFAAPQHSGMPKGEKHESRHEIDQLEESWRNAMMTADIASMSSLLADDFIAIGANGTLHTKEETLARLSNWRTHHTALELSDRKVRFYGTTALVTSLAHVTGTNTEGEPSGSYRYTRVYVRDAQGKWKIVSFEASRIREPGARK